MNEQTKRIERILLELGITSRSHLCSLLDKNESLEALKGIGPKRAYVLEGILIGGPEGWVAAFPNLPLYTPTEKATGWEME